jgi:hypothetical protein
VPASEPLSSVLSGAPSGGPKLPPPPQFVLELEQCFQRVKAGELQAATMLEFRARRHHDKSVRSVFDPLPHLDEPLELTVFIWMNAHPSENIAPRDLALALIYISQFRHLIFFSAPAIPRLEVLAAHDDEALRQFCTILNSCPDLNVDAVYRAVGRQKKIYSVYEATPLAELIEEFNALKPMGNLEVFPLDDVGPVTQKHGAVGFVRQDRRRQVRVESYIDVPAFRKLQARLHFEDREEILLILSQSSAYSSFLSAFVSIYVAGYEMPTAELANRLGAVLVRGQRTQ